MELTQRTDTCRPLPDTLSSTPVCASVPNWTVLDTCFSNASAFLRVWLSWRTQRNRPEMLHFVGLLAPHEVDPLHQVLQELMSDSDSTQSQMASELLSQCYALTPGFHRILLQGGQVSLTLCVGQPEAMLAELQMQAQNILALNSRWTWDKWRLKALARLCSVGARVDLPDNDETHSLDYAAAGFTCIAGPDKDTGLELRFAPAWNLRDKRYARPALKENINGKKLRCAVIGAGLAGASVANALARRGWQVDVYDQADQCAAGASGLPAGLLVPHFSQDDSPRSRMSRAGIRLMLDHARRLLKEGVDWKHCGALELQPAPDATALRTEGNLWTSDGAAFIESQTEVNSVNSVNSASGAYSPVWAENLPNPNCSLWHDLAAWIKPARLVEGWLDHPGINWHPLKRLHTLRENVPQSEQGLNSGHRWQLLDDESELLGEADIVVFANARGCIDVIHTLKNDTSIALVPDLIEKLGATQILHGSISMGECPTSAEDSPFPPFAVNGHGSFLSGIPNGEQAFWACGSTFEPDAVRAMDCDRAHASNLDKLSTLLPSAAKVLAPQFAGAQVQAWAGTRLVSHDRLPLVGPVEQADVPSLWISAGMGARGLSFSALCAELLVAQIAGETLPIEASLAKGLSSQRWRRSAKALGPDAQFSH